MEAAAVVWVVLCALAGFLSKSRGRPFWPAFLLSLMISPFVMLLLILIGGKGHRGPQGAGSRRGSGKKRRGLKG